MRQHSPFLEDLLFHTPKSEVDLGGSSPVFPFGPEFFADIKLKTTVARLTPEYDELRQIMGEKLGVQSEQILFTPGSSQGLTQVLATISEAGQTILIEQPSYDPFVFQSELLGLSTKFFERTGNETTDSKNIAAAKTEGTTILLLTNPHAPLGGFYSEDFIRQLCTEFQWVIVDEDFFPLFSDGRMTNIIEELPKNLITLHSFNKAVGLVYVRLGMVRATADLIHRIDLMGNLFHIDIPTPSLQMAHKAALHWDEIIAKLQSRLKPMQEKMHEFAKRHPDQMSHDFKTGFFVMLKVPKKFKDGQAFSAEFLKETGIYMRPGRFLGMPEWVRFHIFMSEKQGELFLKSLQKCYS